MHKFLKSSRSTQPLPNGISASLWVKATKVDVSEYLTILIRPSACNFVSSVSTTTDGVLWTVVEKSWNALGECYFDLGTATIKSSLELNVHIRMLGSYFGMSSFAIVAQSFQRDVFSTSETVNAMSMLWLPNSAVIDMPVVTKNHTVFTQDIIDVDFNDILSQVDSEKWQMNYTVVGYEMVVSDSAVASFFTLTAHGFDTYSVANGVGSYLFPNEVNNIRGGVISVADYVGELSFTLRGSLISPVFGARPLAYYVKYEIRIIPLAKVPTLNLMSTSFNVKHGDSAIVIVSTNVIN